MFGTYFYHQRIRKAVAVFGSLFNNINVVRTNSAGAVMSQVKVPLSYAPKRDFLARIDATQDGEEAERQIAIKLPRMSFEITNMQYDPARQLPKMNKCVTFPTNFEGGARELYTPVPYLIGFQLNVYAKSQDDALQIVEQILPYFTPQYTVTVKPLSDFDTKEDTPISLVGITFSDDYEGLIESRRSIIYTLDFEMKLSLYKNIAATSAVITSADVNIYDYDDTDNLYSTVEVRTFSKAGLSGSLLFEDGGTITNSNFKIDNVPAEVSSLEILTAPSNGTATATLTANTTTALGKITSTGTWTYTPNADWYGSDSFVIKANFVGGGSINSTITVSVQNPEKDAINDAFTFDLAFDNYIDFNVAANDDFETTGGVTYSISAGGYPSNGSVQVLNANTGAFRYTPNAGFTGTDTFLYRATPATGQSETGIVTITVNDTASTMIAESGALIATEQDIDTIIAYE